jgi:hypothetical protein
MIQKSLIEICIEQVAKHLPVKLATEDSEATAGQECIAAATLPWRFLAAVTFTAVTGVRLPLAAIPLAASPLAAGAPWNMPVTISPSIRSQLRKITAKERSQPPLPDPKGMKVVTELLSSVAALRPSSGRFWD